MRRFHFSLARSQSGQGLIEYLILVAILAVGTMVAVRLIGQSLNVKFARVAEALGADVQGTLATPRLDAGSLGKKDMRNFMNGSLRRDGGGGRTRESEE